MLDLTGKKATVTSQGGPDIPRKTETSDSFSPFLEKIASACSKAWSCISLFFAFIAESIFSAKIDGLIKTPSLEGKILEIAEIIIRFFGGQDEYKIQDLREKLKDDLLQNPEQVYEAIKSEQNKKAILKKIEFNYGVEVCNKCRPKIGIILPKLEEEALIMKIIKQAINAAESEKFQQNEFLEKIKPLLIKNPAAVLSVIKMIKEDITSSIIQGYRKVESFHSVEEIIKKATSEVSQLLQTYLRNNRLPEDNVSADIPLEKLIQSIDALGIQKAEEIDHSKVPPKGSFSFSSLIKVYSRKNNCIEDFLQKSKEAFQQGNKLSFSDLNFARNRNPKLALILLEIERDIAYEQVPCNSERRPRAYTG